MVDELIALLETFGYDVIRQGSLAEDESYKDTFFTFWNNNEEGQSFYDNETASATYDFDINVYSTDPDKAYTLLDNARNLLKQNGWTIITRAYDVASDEITHIGRGMRITYLKNFN